MKETIEEGQDLTPKLLESLKHDPKLLAIVEDIHKQVASYVDYLEFVLILKHESFKDRHWDVTCHANIHHQCVLSSPCRGSGMRCTSMPRNPTRTR